MDDVPHDLIQDIENDDFYKYFLHKNVPKPSQSIAEQVKRLGEGIDLISSELQKQVIDKHTDLLKQANHATELENVVATMNDHVQNLFANAERLKNQIWGPYKALESHTQVLEKLHLASHILRLVNRIQQLSKRLSNTSDPIQKATILNELEQLASDPDLEDIDAVTTELRNIRQQRHKVVQLATGSLNQGIVNENKTQTQTALQIFINLETIDSTLDSFTENCLKECRENLNKCLNISSVSLATSGGKSRGMTSSLGFRSKIKSEIERIFTEEIYQHCKQVKFLQSVIDLSSFESQIASEFWSKLGEIIQEEIHKSPVASQQTLQEDYPKLLKLYRDMIEKLKYKDFTFKSDVLSLCETSFLSASLTRLLDPAQSMFNVTLEKGRGEAPNHDTMDALIRIITTELSVALVDDSLSDKVCKNVSKCIKMFALKTEQQIETGPECSQVIAGAPNSGQQRNVQYANALYYFQTQVQRILNNMKDSLTDNSTELMVESVQVLTTLTSSIMLPIVDSIKSAIDSIIVTLHLESDWSRLQLPVNNKATVSSSPYMRELTQFIVRVYHTYLTNFDNKEVLLTHCSDISVHCIELLIRHASLLRPLSPGGRFRLHCDFQHLEHALKGIYPQLADLGRPYRLMKSMASLIMLSPEEVVKSQANDSSVPHSTVLLLLFSHAGSELASPHQNTGWSLPKLSTWLDEHKSERDRLDLVAGALQRYESLIRHKNSVNYDPVYPIMSQFLEYANSCNC